MKKQTGGARGGRVARWRCSASMAAADAVSDAKAWSRRSPKPNPPWDGPTTGPDGRGGKTIVYVSTDQRNGGARGVGEGVKEAAGKIGWTFRLSTARARSPAASSGLEQAIASQPDVIVLGGIDATEQAAAVEAGGEAGDRGRSAGIPTPRPARIDTLPIFTNITTDPLEVARAAASYRLRAEPTARSARSIFTDSTYEIAVARSARHGRR